MKAFTYVFMLFGAFTVSANVLSRDTTVLKTTKCSENKRVEWRRMSKEDKTSFVDAITCLMDAPPSGAANVSNRFEELAWAHNQLFATVHQSALFLPWHRYLIHIYETMLRDECGYKAPFPWWYELQDAGDFASSGLFEPEYFGTLREIESNGPDQPADPSPCVEDGVSIATMTESCTLTQHTQISFNRTISVGLERPQCLKRGEVKYYSSWATQDRIDACESKNMTKYENHAECVNNGGALSSIHTATHVALGDIMAFIPASPNDPIFFMHHGFIDWQWRRWQRMDDERSKTSKCYLLADVAYETDMYSFRVCLRPRR